MTGYYNSEAEYFEEAAQEVAAARDGNRPYGVVLTPAQTKYLEAVLRDPAARTGSMVDLAAALLGEAE